MCKDRLVGLNENFIDSVQALTLNLQADALANRRWDSVGCDAQIRTHMQATGFGQVQYITLDGRH